jgi:ribose transport system substrate-binding protein
MSLLSRLVPVALAATALVAAGCGSSDDSDSTSTSAPAASTAAATTEAAATDSGGGQFAEIKAQVEKLTERPTQIPQTTPLDKPPAKGKTISYLQCGAPVCVTLGEYLTEAAQAVGWKVNVIDEGGTPETVKAAWGEAVRQKPDAIVPTGGFPHEIFGDELKQAKSMNIPVVGHSEAVPADPATGFISMASGPERQKQIGTDEANWIISSTDGDANVFFVDSGYPINGLQLQALKEQLAAECPDTCKVESYQAPVTSIGKDLAGKVASQLQAHPDTNYLVPAFGDMAIGIPAALAASSIKQPPMLTQEPSAPNMADIRKGDLVSLNGSGPESMWGIVDVLARYFNDEDYPTEIPLPSWFITKDNAPAEDTFPTVVDYQEQFKKLWGV